VIFSLLTERERFAASVRGHVMLLDTFVTRPERSGPGRTQFRNSGPVALDPDYLFIGHGYFDHADTRTSLIAHNRRGILRHPPETCDTVGSTPNNFNNHDTRRDGKPAFTHRASASLPWSQQIVLYTI